MIEDEMMNGRFYTRGRIIRLDKHGQTFVVRLVNTSLTYYAFGRTFLRNTS